MFSIFIVTWIIKLVFFFPSDYDIRHGKYVAISYVFILAYLAFSFISLLYVFLKNKYYHFIVLGIGFLVFIVECSNMIGIGQE